MMKMFRNEIELLYDNSTKWEVNFLGIFHLNLPETEGWKELLKKSNVQSEEVQKKLFEYGETKVLYKIKKDTGDAELFDFYEENMNFEDDVITVPFSSTFNAVVLANRGAEFRNMVGTSGDRPEGINARSWLGAYSLTTGEEPWKCSSDGNFYYDKNQIEVEICNSVECPICKNKYNLVGAHIESNNGSNGAGIVPLCNAHNSKNNGYMIFRQDTKVMLINYVIPSNRYYNELTQVKGKMNNEKCSN